MKTLTRIAFVLISAAAPLLAADTVELKQRWIAGKHYFLSAQTSQQSTFTVGPQKMDQVVNMTMEMNVVVRAHEDGKRKRLTMKYDRMAMEMTMNGQKFTYDSALPNSGTDPMNRGKTLGAMIGKELKMLTNEQDEVAEIENYDEYVKQFSSAGAMDGIDFTKTLTREGLLQSLKQGALQSYPGKAVGAGESWPFTNQVVIPQIGSVTIKGTNTYKGTVERAGARCAEIQSEGRIEMDLSPANDPASAPGLGGLGMKVTAGTLKGPIWFDTQLGAARDSELVQEMTISMKSPLDPAATLDIPMKQTIKTILIRVEDLK